MNDRINYITVSLEHDMRDDDVECIINAIKSLRFVLNVEPNVSSPSDWMAVGRAKADLRGKIWEALK